MDFLVQELKNMRKTAGFPDFDACIIAGDTFNSPRIYQGDVVSFFDILDALNLTGKPVGWINGNHDPGGFHVCQAVREQAVNLEIQSFMGISGHSHSQNLDEVRSWLKQCESQITVTHQSASMFMNLGNLEVEQLRPADFHAPLNIIGDTHITGIWQENGVVCLSPGILCPMRSRAELETSEPRLVWLEADYLGDGKFDLEHAVIDSAPIRKRPHMFVDTKNSIDKLMGLVENRQAWEPPVLAFIEGSENQSIVADLEKSDNLNIRIISYIKNIDLQNQEEDISIDLGGSVTVNTMVEAAGALIPDDSKDKATTLSLVKDLLSSDSPAEIVTNYLKG
jgi:predicted phosphodiesterase